MANHHKSYRFKELYERIDRTSFTGDEYDLVCTPHAGKPFLTFYNWLIAKRTDIMKFAVKRYALDFLHTRILLDDKDIARGLKSLHNVHDLVDFVQWYRLSDIEVGLSILFGEWLEYREKWKDLNEDEQHQRNGQVRTGVSTSG